MEYRVKILYLSGRGNKVFKSGDTVTEKNFPEGHVELLVKDGKLEQLGSKKVVDEKVKEPVIETKKVEEKPTRVHLDYKEITAKELKAELGLEDSKMSKKELYAEYLKLD